MEKYFKDKYFIAFYDGRDEYLVTTFNNIYEIIEYIRKKRNEDISYNKIYFAIYHAIKNGGTTTILDGRKLYVHIYEVDDEEDEKDEICKNSI